MNSGFIKKRVRIDGVCSLDISINEEMRTVIANLITPSDEPVMVYAEKFDEPCNYLKIGLKRGIDYLNLTRELANEKSVIKNNKKHETN